MTKRALLTAAMSVLVCTVSAHLVAQESDQASPTVSLVATVGCVEQDGDSWFLTRATTPMETELPFATFNEVEDAGRAELGSNRLQLVGVTDFLDAEGLLASYQRAEFTAPESVNATGQLADGHKVAVKGLHITTAEPHRVNLTSLFSLAETCG